MKYAYSPLLRAPDRAIDVDMEKPAVVRMMKSHVQGQAKGTVSGVDETAGRKAGADGISGTGRGEDTAVCDYAR